MQFSLIVNHKTPQTHDDVLRDLSKSPNFLEQQGKVTSRNRAIRLQGKLRMISSPDRLMSARLRRKACTTPARKEAAGPERSWRGLRSADVRARPGRAPGPAREQEPSFPRVPGGPGPRPRRGQSTRAAQQSQFLIVSCDFLSVSGDTSFETLIWGTHKSRRGVGGSLHRRERKA